VDLDQPADFIGKKSLARIHAEGVKRRLVALEMQGDPLQTPNESFWPVHAGNSQVGRVTSCVHSPRLRKNIGIAMIDIGHTDIGSRLSVTSPHEGFAAVVVPMPFVAHKLK
jgi:aminomethyltransferase